MSQIIPDFQSVSYGLKQDRQYLISKDDEKIILIVFSFLPISQK